MSTQKKSNKLPKARENVSDQAAFGLRFTSDWLRGWRKFLGPFRKYNEAKPMQFRITFDTQMKPVVNPVLFRISVGIRWKNSLLLREKGGVEAEREERERWITREQQKIMDSFNGKRIQPFLTRDLWF